MIGFIRGVHKFMTNDVTDQIRDLSATACKKLEYSIAVDKKLNAAANTQNKRNEELMEFIRIQETVMK